MKYPFCHIKRSWLIGAISGYAGYMMVIYLIYLPQKWHYAQYNNHMSSCLFVILNIYYVPVFAAYFGAISLVLELTLPSLVTFVCFCISAFVLMTRPAVGNSNDTKFRQVSVTIAIFTAVFLMCNIPCFLFLMWDLFGPVGFLPLDYDDLLSGDHTYLKYYFQLMTMLFPVFLNAAINPLLYLLRMRGYQNWIRQAVKNLTDSVHLTTRTSTAEQQNYGPISTKNMTDEEAAVRIQSQYKGFKVRKEIQEKKESKAATRIQANFRGHKTRKQLAGPEGEEEEAFPNDGTDDCPGYSEEEAAAIKIQANFRGHKTRKQLAGKEEQ
ncbi:uncharacterized protein LOC134822473 isoform X2 [Bolinopsis microptera]|uniref:uncharacterized protein LOC134822473 isoform X2 n=1 Tax=Bolinopsis microptera TaxID=2820187 RepID=UPI0030792FBD